MRQRREESYKENVNTWEKKGGSVDVMKSDSFYKTSPTSRSSVRPFKPQPLTESEKFWIELDDIIEELESD